MAYDEEFKERVMDLLIPFGEITEKKMFGGYGIFEDGAMFALISGSELYFKADDSNRAGYEVMGSAKFGKMPYFRVPDDVLDDQPALHRMIEEAIAVSRAARLSKG